MRSAGSHSTSGREKEGKKERTEKENYIWVYDACEFLDTEVIILHYWKRGRRINEEEMVGGNYRNKFKRGE